VGTLNLYTVLNVNWLWRSRQVSLVPSTYVATIDCNTNEIHNDTHVMLYCDSVMHNFAFKVQGNWKLLKCNWNSHIRFYVLCINFVTVTVITGYTSVTTKMCVHILQITKTRVNAKSYTHRVYFNSKMLLLCISRCICNTSWSSEVYTTIYKQRHGRWSYGDHVSMCVVYVYRKLFL